MMGSERKRQRPTSAKLLAFGKLPDDPEAQKLWLEQFAAAMNRGRERNLRGEDPIPVYLSGDVAGDERADDEHGESE